jgi:hypothetical protein
MLKSCRLCSLLDGHSAYTMLPSSLHITVYLFWPQAKLLFSITSSTTFRSMICKYQHLSCAWMKKIHYLVCIYLWSSIGSAEFNIQHPPWERIKQTWQWVKCQFIAQLLGKCHINESLSCLNCNYFERSIQPTPYEATSLGTLPVPSVVVALYTSLTSTSYVKCRHRESSNCVWNLILI